MFLGPDDLVMFVVHYLPSFVVAIVVSVLLLGTGLFLKRRPELQRWRRWALLSVPLPGVLWVFYFLTTEELTMTTCLLNSESSSVAERVYDNQFKTQVKSLNAAVKLAVGAREEPNVRFYASCLVADILATNEPTVVANTLEKVADAPEFTTEFFNGNRLTASFYKPGHAQPTLTVRQVVEQRLKDLGSSAKP